jgi:hypothetical protein
MIVDEYIKREPVLQIGKKWQGDALGAPVIVAAIENAPAEKVVKLSEIKPCYLCDNARLNKELEDYNDFHSSIIGSFSRDCRIMLTSGSGKPLQIEIARWNDNVGQWDDIGIYNPKYCPECGREIVEYKNNEKTK